MVLAALLGVVMARPATAVAVALVAATVVVRWGTASLEAVAGAQAVLGAAGAVGPPAAAASAWLGAAALVLGTPYVGRRTDPRSVLLAAATAASAALLVAGPADALAVRLAAGLAFLFLAIGVSRLPWRHLLPAGALAAAVLAGALAVQ